MDGWMASDDDDDDDGMSSDDDGVDVDIMRRDGRDAHATTTTTTTTTMTKGDGRAHTEDDEAVDLLSADATGGTPTWFDARVFSSDSFDALKYVEEMTGFVSNETLLEQLNAEEEKIREELGTLVNENYEEFASLGDGLKDYEALKKSIEPESKEMREEVVRARDEMVQALERLEASVEEREASARTSASKRLADECAHTVSKVERLLGELDIKGEGARASSDAPMDDETEEKALASQVVLIAVEDKEGLDMLEPAFEDDQANPGDMTEDMHQSHVSDNVDERARMLDRVASEVNRLKFYQKQGKDLPLIRDLADRIEYCELKLMTLVQTALIDGLMEKNANIVSHCLHACTAIGKLDVIETAIRSICIQPAVEKAIEGGSEEDFSTMLQRVTDVAFESCAYVLELTRDADSGLHSYDFVAGTILAEVDSQLSATQSNAFSPGIPKVFIKNYRAAMNFLHRLENSAPTIASLNQFRASKHVEVFMKRWNLPVYFSLRFQELAGNVDDELNKPGLDTSLASDGFLLTSTTQTWLTMCKCTADDVFVPALADKFIRLMAQVLARYKSWVTSGIETLAIQQNTESTGDAMTMGSNKTSWGGTAGGEELILVRLDIERLCERVRTDGVKNVETGVKSLGNELTSIATGCILDGAKDVESLIPKLSEFIIKVFVDRCVEALKQLKGITATFRMTNKPMPTRHSHFVPMILAPLETFLDAERTKMLSKESRQEIVGQVVESVCDKYAEMARELVSTVKKTEASLNRLKDRQGKTSSAGVGDTDKICRQLYLDVKEFSLHIENFGINVKESKSFAELWQAVESGKEK